jgi:hypothetical protein
MMMHPAMMGQSPLSPALQQQAWMHPQRIPYAYSNHEDLRREHHFKHNGVGKDNHSSQQTPLHAETVDDFSNNNNTSTQSPQPSSL